MKTQIPTALVHSARSLAVRRTLRAAQFAGRALLITIASILTAFVVLAAAGAYLPSIPKVGIVGSVIAGQWPLHLSMIIGGVLVLTAAAWKFGPHRTGRVLTLATMVAGVAVAAIMLQQFTYASRHGAAISWHDVFTQMAYPATTPDSTSTYTTVEGQALNVDTYLPANRDGHPTPAIVLAHSGGFHAVDFTKSDLRGTARWLADHGIATFAIDYRLATPTSPTWNKAPQDLVCALAWVHEHATEYNIDPTAISVGGMSAGGALALNAAYRLHDNTITSSCGPLPPVPASVVAFYPALDIDEMWRNDRSGTRNAATLFTGGSPDTFPDRYRDTSPTSHVGPGLMPTLLVVGDGDHSATPSSVTRFGDQLRRNGNPVTITVLPFADHTFDDAYGSITSQTSRHILNNFLHGTP